MAVRIEQLMEARRESKWPRTVGSEVVAEVYQR